MRDRAGLELPLSLRRSWSWDLGGCLSKGQGDASSPKHRPRSPLVLAEASVFRLQRASVCCSQARAQRVVGRAAEPAPRKRPAWKSSVEREEGALSWVSPSLLVAPGQTQSVSRGSLTEGWGRVCDLSLRKGNAGQSVSHGGGEAVRLEEAGPWRAVSGAAWPSLW